MNISTEAYRAAIGLHTLNKQHYYHPLSKFKRLKIALREFFDCFFGCFWLALRIFKQITGSIIMLLMFLFNSFTNWVSHSERIMVLIWFFGRNKIDFELALFTLLLLTMAIFCLHFSTILILMCKIIIRKNCVMLFFIFAVHLNSNLMQIYFLKYSDKSSKWLFICNDIETNPGPKTEDFRFMHWNLNSITAHKFERIPLLNAYMVQHKLHIAAISETALSKQIPNSKIDIPGYTPIRFDLVDNDSHGGS